MSPSNESRSLRLERLESRSLLAAGIFDSNVMDFSADSTQAHHRHAADRPSHVDQRGDTPGETRARGGDQADVGGQKHAKAPGRDHHVNRQSHSAGRHSHRSHDSKGLRHDRPTQQPTGSTLQTQPNFLFSVAPLTQTNTEPGIQTLGNISVSAGDEVSRTAPSLDASPQRRELSSPFVPTSDSSSSAPLNPDTLSVVSTEQASQSDAEPADEQVIEGVAEQPNESAMPLAESSTNESATNPMRSAEMSDSAASLLGSGRQATDDGLGENVLENVLENNGMANDDFEDGGFIEWSALSQRIRSIRALSEGASKEALRNGQEDLAGRWQLNDNSLSDLEDLSHSKPSEESVDETMREFLVDEWFSPRAGMIALNHVQLPTLVAQVSPKIVELGLESAVALHRSMDSVAEAIAHAPIGPALSGPALDAIMASLQEVATSDAQPIGQTLSFRLPMATYPTVVVVAASVAASSRRKQKRSESNLQFTQDV